LEYKIQTFNSWKEPYLSKTLKLYWPEGWYSNLPFEFFCWHANFVVTLFNCSFTFQKHLQVLCFFLLTMVFYTIQYRCISTVFRNMVPGMFDPVSYIIYIIFTDQENFEKMLKCIFFNGWPSPNLKIMDLKGESLCCCVLVSERDVW